MLATGVPVYGVNTGMGALSGVRLSVAQQREPGRALPTVMQQKPQQMRRIKVARIGCKNIAIDSLGLVEPTRAVQFDRLLQFRQLWIAHAAG